MRVDLKSANIFDLQEVPVALKGASLFKKYKKFWKVRVFLKSVNTFEKWILFWSVHVDLKR